MARILLVAPLVLLTGCVSEGPKSQLGTQQKASRHLEMSRTTDCAFQSTITDFDVLDDRHVVLYTMGRRKAYLTEIAGGCFDVKTQSTLAAVDGDRNGQICGFGRDSIAYRRLGMVEQCPILGMQELSNERREELGIAAPSARPKKDKPKKPDESGETKP
jgi:Family of unknown function (DUF6491)